MDPLHRDPREEPTHGGSAVPMFLGNESKRLDVVMEFYRQALSSMRMFVDLRFKHFTTFMVRTGLIGAAAFNVSAVSAWRPAIIGISIAVVILFWVIDARTAQYTRQELARAQTFERALNEGVCLLLPPEEPVRIRSSTATNLLFGLLLISWTGALVATLAGRSPDSEQGTVITYWPDSSVAPGAIPEHSAGRPASQPMPTAPPTAPLNAHPSAQPNAAPAHERSANATEALLLGMMFVSGTALVVFRSTKTSVALGASLLAGATLFSGFKLINIEKVELFKKLFDWSTKVEATVVLNQQQSYQIAFPPFESGHDTPTPAIACFAATLRVRLQAPQNVNLIVVTGGSDRQELRPELKAKYGSNWALAQRRASAVRDLLEGDGGLGVPVVLGSAGPVNTEPEKRDAWSQDRRAIVTVLAKGSVKEYESLEANIKQACAQSR